MKVRCTAGCDRSLSFLGRATPVRPHLSNPGRTESVYYLPDALQEASELGLLGRGLLPPQVFADWIEERWPECPLVALRALRGWPV